MEKKCILYLGNGYDVAWGFNTRYCQFLECELFDKIIGTCKLAKWIKAKYSEDKNRWSDLEELLAMYSIFLRDTYKNDCEFKKETEQFIKDHECLTITLQNYIAEQLFSSPGSAYMMKLEESWKSAFDIKSICCFNYSANAVYSKLINEYGKLDRIHGELTPNEKFTKVKIKLGVDRSMKISPEHTFLYKDTMPTYSFGIWSEPNKRLRAAGKVVKPTVSVFHPEFFDVDYIVIYGCSIGESDTAYYKYLFDNVKDQKIIIYYYQENERKKITQRIIDISFYPVNDILFIDDSIYNGYREYLGRMLLEKWH